MFSVPLPSIHCYFVVHAAPEGEAPEVVRQAWVGLALPVRHDRPVEGPLPMQGLGVETRTPRSISDAVIVTFADAMNALGMAGHGGAVGYWESRCPNAPSLAFRAGEGRLIPVDLARRLFLDLDHEK